LLAWIAVDANQLYGVPQAEFSDYLVFLLAGLAGGGLVHLVVLVIVGISGLFGVKRPLLCVMPGVLLTLLCLTPRILELFTGDWISEQAWQPIARIAAVVLFGATMAWAGRVFLRFACRSTGRRALTGFSFAALSFLFFYLDDLEFLARKYAAAHDILAFLGLTAAGLCFLSWSSRGWSKVGALQLLCGIVVLVLTLTGVLDKDAPGTRELLLRTGRISSRVLSLISSNSRADELGPIDQALLDQLESDFRIDSKSLDALMPNRRRQDVIIITIDTLRHDALASQGGRAKTPHMDRFVEESVYFKHAWSQFPSTRYAVNSLLAGQYPTSVDLENEEAATKGKNLPESLGDAGYVTLAFTSFPTNLFAVDKKHLTRGFDNFENDPGGRATKSKRVVDKTIAAFNQRPENGPPIFLWLHLFDPHGPFTNRGELGSDATLRDRYDQEVEYADTCLGTFFAYVKSKLKDPLVILHSDHGEEFGEHGGVGHNSSLYEEQIHVPLVIRGHGIKPGVRQHPVELVDVPATVRELLDLPQGDFDKGHSLAGLIVDEQTTVIPPGIGFGQFRWPQFVHGNLDAVREGKWKLIHDRDLDLFELYDLAADPSESENLASKRPGDLGRLQTVLQTMRRYAGSADEEETSRRKEKELVLSAVAGSLDEAEFKHFATLLRRGELEDAGQIAALLDHEESRVRQMTLIYVMTRQNEVGKRHLRQRLSGGASPMQIEARIALAICGDEIPLADLPLVTHVFPGPMRLLPFLARVVAGQKELAPALHQNISAGEGDPDVDTLMIQTLLSLKDVDLLPTLYIRLGLGQVNAEQVGAAVKVAEQFSFELASPIIRRILCSPDQGLRQKAEAVIGALPRYGTWQDDAVAAERLALKSKHLFNGRLKTIVQCRGLLADAIDMMASRSILDYGLVLDLSVLINSWGQRPQLVAPVQSAINKSQVTSGAAKEIIDRLLKIAETPRKDHSGKMELLPGQSIMPGELGRIPLLVRVTLDEKSSPMVGGLALETEYLSGTLLSSEGKAIGFPLGFILPTTGLLAGESMILCAPVILPADVKPGSKIALEMGRGGNKRVLPPLYLELP
jgi:arylsulfatase A-like enzyme